MKADLLNIEVQEWINHHRNDALHHLAFQRSPFSNISIQELLTQITGKNKLKHKVEWLTQRNDVLYPPSLNLEQSSSWDTAQYKANLFAEAHTIVDLTGGFGIDSIAFSKIATKVIHLEPNIDLQHIAQHNFKNLNLNIDSYPISADEWIDKNLNYDYFYLDPSRRDQNLNKVFLLSDLSPNPLSILGKLKSYKKIIVKLSPLFDLTALVQAFPTAKTIHIVALKNEVKELLVEFDQLPPNELKVNAVNLLSNDEIYSFPWGKPQKNKDYSEVKKYIYEPNASIQKSQNFSMLEDEFNLFKLAPNTQLWTSDIYYQNFPGRIYEYLRPLENLKKELKNESIQVVHRNFPENIKTLKKRYKFKADGTSPVIFTSSLNKTLTFWAKRLK